MIQHVRMEKKKHCVSLYLKILVLLSFVSILKEGRHHLFPFVGHTVHEVITHDDDAEDHNNNDDNDDDGVRGGRSTFLQLHWL